MRRNSLAVIAGLVVLVNAASALAWQADQAIHQEILKNDFAQLQGTWESTRRVGNKTIRSVKTIEGNKTRLTRFDPDGVIYWVHTSEFKLSISGKARIFTFFNLEVTAGRNKGEKAEEPCSFIYKVDNDTFAEAHGFLLDEEDGEPRAAVWKRVSQPRTDARTHEGVWKPIAAVLGGVRLPEPAVKAITLKITGENYEVTVEGENEPDKGTCTLDTTTNPNRITINSTDGANCGKTFLAIYEMKDAVSMRVCYDLSGKEFPKEFKAPKGTQLYLVGYRRQKEQQAKKPSPK